MTPEQLKDQTDEDWAKQHHEQAKDFLRRALARAIDPHLGLTHAEGHLSVTDMQREVLALYMAIPAAVAAAKKGDRQDATET